MKSIDLLEVNKPHILVVDDDVRILDLLKKFLRKNGYYVSGALSAKAAQDSMQKFVFDIIIIDVMMPEITGLEFAKSIKDSNNAVPVILLTALSEPEDRVAGLATGANDYISKPFDPQELLLRIQNLLVMNSAKNDSMNLVWFGSSKCYNIATKRMMHNGSVMLLSSSEQKLLEIFLSHSDRILERDVIARLLGVTNTRTIDVQVVKLRSKIEEDAKNPKFLQTIRGKGYMLYK